MIYQDPALPHQLRMVADLKRDLIAVSCNCMQDKRGRFIPLIKPGHTFPPAKALAAYKAHIEKVGGP